jgi:hypothetical protein
MGRVTTRSRAHHLTAEPLSPGPRPWLSRNKAWPPIIDEFVPALPVVTTQVAEFFHRCFSMWSRSRMNSGGVKNTVNVGAVAREGRQLDAGEAVDVDGRPLSDGGDVVPISSSSMMRNASLEARGPRAAS